MKSVVKMKLIFIEVLLKIKFGVEWKFVGDVVVLKW